MIPAKEVRDKALEYAEFLEEKARKHNVSQPQYLARALADYAASGQIGSGSFLSNILDNKLKETVIGADDVNRYQLFELISWLRDSIPIVMWDREEWASLDSEERIQIMDRFMASGMHR